MDYISINKKAWNEQTDIHIASAFYDMPGFKRNKNSLNEIELALLGNVANKSILHLQCHFGQDSLSLAHMGAQVTGLDFSDKAILRAQEMAKELQIPARFVCCDVYETRSHVAEQFDIVFTSYGTIGWLPNLQKWAKAISESLKPGGKLVFVEFHPFVWMMDDQIEKISYSYFNVQNIEEESEGTYADTNAAIQTKTISWNHPLSEVFEALMANGLQLRIFQEFDYSPYNCFKGLEEFEPKKFRSSKYPQLFPFVYALVAEKVK